MTLLDSFSEVSSKIYLNGKFRESKSTSTIDVIDPATENRLGEIPETTQVEMEEVIASANKAQKNMEFQVCIGPQSCSAPSRK